MKKCALCNGELKNIRIKYLKRFREDIGTVIFEDVPIKQCTKCKERFYSSEILRAIDKVLLKKLKPPKKVKVEMPAYPKEVYLTKIS